MGRYARQAGIGMLAIAVMVVGLTSLSGAAWADCGKCEKTASKPAGDIVDTAVSAGKFNTLVAAVKAAGLVEALKAEGPITVFAPTDEAFGKLPEGTIAELLKPENKDKLTAILTYHVVPGKVTAEQVLQMKEIKTLQGESLTVSLKDGKPYVDGAMITAVDIHTSNGVIHVLDRVVTPDGAASE